MTKSFSKLMCLFFLLLSPNYLSAKSPPNKGFSIAIEADKKDQGYKGYTVEATMNLKDSKGKQTTTRDFVFKFKEVPSDAEKSLTLFKSPANVKGTILLTHGHQKRDDEQWLYLPAFRRVKRIASSNQTGSFLGSEFSYEDMRAPILGKYTYKYIKEEKCKSRTCFMIERYPTNKKSGYKKQLVWLDKKTHRVFKIEFFNKKNQHSKTFQTQNYKLYKKSHWRPSKVIMKNHLSKKVTEIIYKKYDFNKRPTDSDFNSNTLKRVR